MTFIYTVEIRLETIGELTMRYAKDHKEKTRQNVLAETATAIKESGLDSLGVGSLMARAGLTHGAFYAHFKSKDELVSEALVSTFNEVRARLETEAQNEADETAKLSSLIRQYLSTGHRDNPSLGCALGCLGSEIARLTPEHKERFAAEVEDWLKAYSQHAGDKRIGYVVACSLIGAIQLSRLFDNQTKSEDVLETTKQGLGLLIEHPSSR